jgi:hypothetical protein
MISNSIFKAKYATKGKIGNFVGYIKMKNTNVKASEETSHILREDILSHITINNWSSEFRRAPTSQ